MKTIYSIKIHTRNFGTYALKNSETECSNRINMKMLELIDSEKTEAFIGHYSHDENEYYISKKIRDKSILVISKTEK